MTIQKIQISEDQLSLICNKYLIKELSIFGSALRKDFDEDSDIDLLIEFKPEAAVSLFDLIDVKEDFEKLFGREIDIVSKNAIKRSNNYIRKKAILENYNTIYAA